MKILCIDTSSSDTLLGLYEDERVVLGEKISSSDHAVRLLVSLEQMLQKTGMQLKDIDVFAVVLGPGSFTGLRIGLSTVKGFAYALSKPAVGINALDALAHSASLEKDVTVYPVIHSRKGKAFTAGYKKTGATMAQVQAATEVDPTVFFENKKNYVLLGSALEKQPELFTALTFDPCASNHASHEVLCRLAFEKISRKDFVDIRTVEPDYVVSQVASLV